MRIKFDFANALRVLATLLALAGSAGAQAAITTFATFFERVGNPDFVFTNNSPTNATFVATSPIAFSYLNIPGLPADLQGIQNATLTLSKTTAAPATAVGATLTQQFTTASTTLTITRDTPAAEGKGTRTILLQVTGTATLDGLNGSTSGSFNASTAAGQTVVFTSDFLDFTNASIARDLAIALTQITPTLALQGTSGAAGTFLRSFTAVASGNFSSDGVPTVGLPSIAKSFSPTPIAAGGVSTLTFTLTNATSDPFTNVSFSDTYPAGVFNATPPTVVNTCGGTVAGGVAGGTTIGLTGVTLPANSSCTISVHVTALLVNCYNNVSGVINSDQGPGNTASATLCVTAGTPTVITQASAPINLGGQIRDTATLSGGANPTGTITFRLYGPNDATCSGPAIFTSNVAVSGNGNYNSAFFTPTLAGTYRWIANYSGDANNSPTSNACNAPNESVVVGLDTPTLATSASASVALGGQIRDTATLAAGTNPTGTITFNLYGPNDATCSGASIFTANATVTGNGNYNSPYFTPTSPGTYRWIASYSGDANNNPVAHTCNAPNESVVVNPASTTVATTASPGVTIGGSVFDTAVLSGGVNPTGTITFNLYGPNNATCSGAPVFTSTVPVSGNGTYASATFVPSAAGTYRWIANYGGDANNAATANPCNAPNESVVVSLNTTTVVTTASPGVSVGGTVFDTAVLSGGVSPTGTITFSLYGPNDATCSGVPIFTSTVPVAGNGSYPSGTFAPTAPGTYRWIANYGGDANNAATTNPCNAPNESVVVTLNTTTVVTTASPGVAIGGAVFDTAVLSGGSNPTGTITFALYGPNNATCTGAPVFTSTVPVTGNGTYTSDSFTPTAAGTYRWIANYGGDAANAATANPCNAPNESVAVTGATPTVVTTASPEIVLGGTIFDTAVLAGGVNPTGTIQFMLYGPNDATCANAPVFTTTVTVTGNGTYPSAAFTPTAAGTYRWIANYLGDANNVATANACNAPNENVVVTAQTPTIATTASAAVPLGGVVSDTAVLAGGFNPTGSITFRLYGPGDATCTGAVAFTSTVTVTGNGTYTSGNYAPTAVGLYRWVASYSGDANNSPAAHACDAPNESVSVLTPGGGGDGTTPIPTLGETAMLLLMLMLASSGAWMARRRR